MKDFFDEHFNTILITFLILVFVAFTIHIIHDGRDATALQWVENLTGQFVSALLTLLVTKKSSADKSSSDTPAASVPPAESGPKPS